MHGKLSAPMPGGRDVPSELNAQLIKESAKTIKVIHEGVDTDPELEQARNLLKASEVICFLGFGYARRQLLLPINDNYFCRRRVSKGAPLATAAELGNCRRPVAGHV